MLTEDIEDIVVSAKEGFRRLGASTLVTLVEANGGFDASDIDRIPAPIGLVQKVRDAQTLALSSLAEIAAVRNETSHI